MQNIATFIALNRFGLGVGPEEARAVDRDPRGWIQDQIQPRQEISPMLAQFPGASEINKEIHKARISGSQELRKTVRRKYREVFVTELVARARHHVQTPSPFAERMVLFWSNHFTVSRTKGIVGPTLPAFEREAIRPHIFGRFEDMLSAVASHPSMLAYLDNNISVGPNSLAGRRIGRGLNENLAREILELHTLGVNGGYGQDDVREFARALTGWTHAGTVPKRQKTIKSGAFEFRQAMHEPGPKTVLGKTYREDGMNEAKAILKDLAGHSATSRHIATKIARHFIADAPPKSAIDRLAKVFADERGDLAAVSKALVNLEEVWADPAPKVKTPYELVISVLRALGSAEPDRAMLHLPLRTMGHEPFNAPSPQGWPDMADHWLAPEALLRRIEWVRAISGRLAIDQPPSELMDRLIGPIASDNTRFMVDRAPSGDAAVALILASSEFQRR
ncbi:MAG: DUF1800 domain-containing protein [Pseudomonadota bacterium]